MTKVRLLPGSSYRKLLGQAPRHAGRHARFTIGELSLYLARQVSLYHRQKHSGLGMPPLTAWEQAWIINGRPALPQIPECADTFKLTFLPGEWRTVTREGIELYALRYQSANLYPLIHPQRKVMARFDPRDLSHIFVETADEHIRVPLRSAVGTAFSLWEWREIQSQRRRQGAARNPDRIASELKANRSLIESRSHEKGRWHDARCVARAFEWKRSRMDPSASEHLIKSSPLTRVPVCRVKE